MTDDTSVTNEIFPKDSDKSYALVELVRGDGPMVDKGPENTVFSFPIVLLWELILLLGVTLFIFVFSLLKQAPLDEIANPMITTDPAKAPWYFVGLQELLEHMHPTIAGVVIPTILVLFLIAVPYIDYSREGIGTWFSSSRGRRITLFTALYTVVTMTAYIALEISGAGILFGLVAILVIVLWRLKANRREIMLALFTMMLVSAFVLTVSGFLFRGPGFKLYLPWEMPDNYNPWDEF